jgi:tetratricopeptide (TPR) repeat protein
MALNHVALGDYDGARVAIKQAHEIEAQIAELRARQYAEVEESARKRGARTSFKELNGYPIETLDNPEVNALRNAYQSALSHYLAGFIYEALGEPSLAAPGYRLANELQPGQPLLEEARGPDERVVAPDDGMTDVP